MSKIIWASLVMLLAVSFAAGVRAQDAGTRTRQEMRSLDEQVQEIKSDVLGIAKDLTLLEERLLYPTNTQLAVFVSIASGDTFRLDAVQLTIDSELVTHYIYSFKELEALQKGGVQRVWTGNVRTGSHELTVTVNGKLASGRDFSDTQSFTFNKDVDPTLLGLTLADNGGGVAIDFGPW